MGYSTGIFTSTLSLLLLVSCSDDRTRTTPDDTGIAPKDGTVTCIGANCHPDATVTDTGESDAGQPTDSGFMDAAAPDADQQDAVVFPDADQPDLAFPDADSPDLAYPDAAQPDGATFPDATVTDGAFPDATVTDGAFPDATVTDGSLPDGTTYPDATLPDGSIPDVSIPDISFPDAGGDCSHNPNNCAPHELMLPVLCTCLGICEAGWVWNGSSCDRVPVPDAGISDGGGNVDGGVQNCLTDTDCTHGPDWHCLIGNSTGGVTACSGQPNCECEQVCSPNTTTTGCPSGEGCAWIWDPASAYDGVCIADTGGGTQAQACTVTYDTGGNRLTDSCNGAQNYYCFGANPTDPNGLCTRFCPPSDPTVCTALGTYQCDDLGDPTSPVGLCLEPPPVITDLGVACTLPSQCQGNVCSADLQDLCSADCAGLATCPADGLCVVGASNAPICALDCTTGGDALCQARNPQLLCYDIGGPSICLP